MVSLKEFPRALPSGASSGEGLYLTVYPSSCPNTDTIYFIALTTRVFKDKNSQWSKNVSLSATLWVSGSISWNTQFTATAGSRIYRETVTSTVFCSVQCIVLYSPLYCEVYCTVNCTLLCSVLYCTVYFALHYTVLYTVQCNVLYCIPLFSCINVVCCSITVWYIVFEQRAAVRSTAQ